MAAPVRWSVPAPFIVMAPGASPIELSTPPPSMEPVMVVSPLLLRVSGLIIVCRLPPITSDFPLSIVQRLRGADPDRHVERHAFVGDNAAAGDRQRTAVGAVENIARRPGADGHAVGDDRSADGDVRSARGVEGGRGFAVVPGVAGKRVPVHVGARPVVSAERPDARTAASR